MKRLVTIALAAMFALSAVAFAADAPADVKKPEGEKVAPKPGAKDAPVAEEKPEAEKPEYKWDNENQKLSYALGFNVARALKNAEIPLDTEAFAMAIKDVFGGKEAKMTPKQAVEIQMAFEQALQQKQLAELKAKAEANQKASDEFLAANAKKEGVKTTASGLQYKVEREGKGPSPKITDSVTVHYRGALINGKTFDSSYERGKPVTFPLKDMIKGWTEGVMLMKVGAKYILFIPPQLAFGEGGAPGFIEPNSVLIFEVELLKIEDTAPEKDIKE